MGAPGLVAAHHLGTRGGEGVIADSGSRPSTMLDAHLQAVGHQFTHRIGGERHPLLISFDFGGHADGGHRCRQGGMGHGGRNRLFNLAQMTAIGSPRHGGEEIMEKSTRRV